MSLLSVENPKSYFLGSDTFERSILPLLAEDRRLGNKGVECGRMVAKDEPDKLSSNSLKLK